MKYFRATLTHDNGTTTIRTSASSREAAMNKICNAELCPESAVELSEISKGEFYND